MVIQVPKTVKNILDRYDVNSLLTWTIPKNYSIPSAALDVYRTKSKFNTSVSLEMNNDAQEILKNIGRNYPDYTNTEILAYLIEMVCDLSRVHTKNVADALDKYYNIVATDKTRWIKILDAYSDSVYYSDPFTDEDGNRRGGLTEESLAYFLVSSERTETIKLNKLN